MFGRLKKGLSFHDAVGQVMFGVRYYFRHRLVTALTDLSSGLLTRAVLHKYKRESTEDNSDIHALIKEFDYGHHDEAVCTFFSIDNFVGNTIKHLIEFTDAATKRRDADIPPKMMASIMDNKELKEIILPVMSKGEASDTPGYVVQEESQWQQPLHENLLGEIRGQFFLHDSCDPANNNTITDEYKAMSREYAHVYNVPEYPAPDEVKDTEAQEAKGKAGQPDEEKRAAVPADAQGKKDTKDAGYWGKKRAASAAAQGKNEKKDAGAGGATGKEIKKGAKETSADEGGELAADGPGKQVAVAGRAKAKAGKTGAKQTPVDSGGAVSAEAPGEQDAKAAGDDASDEDDFEPTERVVPNLHDSRPIYAEHHNLKPQHLEENMRPIIMTSPPWGVTGQPHDIKLTNLQIRVRISVCSALLLCTCVRTY